MANKLSGRETLAVIDGKLQAARSTLEALHRQEAQASAGLAELRRKELALLTRLAELRLDELARGEVAQSLGGADHEVTVILKERDAAGEALAAELAAVRETLVGHERERTSQQAVVDAASTALDEVEAQAQQRLADDGDYRAELTAASESDRVADQAEEKAGAARADRLEKGKPYEADGLFSYLWRRGYGTTRYRAWPLTRLLDRWVARRCGYETLRRNYAMLTDIPARLEEHAGRMRAAANADLEDLRALEQRAADACGVPAHRQVLTAAEASLAGTDRAIDELEAKIAQLIDRRGQFAAGRDEYSVRCTELLAHAYDDETLAALRARAARTVSGDDDLIVAELADLEYERERVEQDVRQYSQLRETQRTRSADLEELRKDFKSSRYDDSHSVLADGVLIGALLDQLLAGAVGRSDVWNAIRRQQSYRRAAADPLFGSGGFPRLPGPGPWRMPGGGGWHVPKSGGFRTGGGGGGGGFRTGGGFRGGGFRTGGGR